MRKIQNDEELLIVTKVFFVTISKGLEDGQHLVVTPDNVQLPESKEIESEEDFSFEAEEQDIDQAECFRLFGVILYHLSKGQSEYSHEAYHADPVDAYLNLSFESKLWPAVAGMLNGEIQSMEQATEALIDAQREEVKTGPPVVMENENSNIIRVDRSLRLLSAGLTGGLVYPELKSLGPKEYDISQVEIWHHPDQEKEWIRGEIIHEYLKSLNLLEKQLGFEDLMVIQDKGLDFYNQHFRGIEIFAWKSVINIFTLGINVVPYIYAGPRNVIMGTLDLTSIWAPTHQGLCFENTAKKHIIDCDATPHIPAGWTIRPEDQIDGRVAGTIEWQPGMIELFFSERQLRTEWVRGHWIRQEFQGKPLLNACVLDYLLAHTEIIPDDFKDDSREKRIYFWGTIYRNRAHNSCVRYLCFRAGQWISDIHEYYVAFLSSDDPALTAMPGLVGGTQMYSWPPS